MEPDRIRNLWRYRPGVDKMASSGISARYDPLADEKLPPDGSRLPGAKLPRPVHTGTDLTGRALSQPLQMQSPGYWTGGTVEIASFQGMSFCFPIGWVDI